MIESILVADHYQAGPTETESPVTFTNMNFVTDSDGYCTITGTVANTFSEAKENLQLRVVGFSGDRIVTGGFTYVDQVFPGVDATFEVNQYSPAMCPAAVDLIEVMPNLGEDKIFNP